MMLKLYMKQYDYVCLFIREDIMDGCYIVLGFLALVVPQGFVLTEDFFPLFFKLIN